jgi:hypothetical protein
MPQINLSPPATGVILNHAVSVTTSSTQCLGIQRNRLALRFVNPGTVDVYVCPALDANENPLAAVVHGAGTWWILAGSNDTIIDAPGGGAWNCIAASSAVLTIFEYLFFQAN